MERRRSVSMKEVARLAGVSLGTVSNVLNSPDLVTEGTRLKVEQAIDQLGWVRNESARQLRAGRSSAIAIVVLDVGNPFFTDVARGAEEYVDGKGLIVQLGNSDQRAEREARLLDQVEQQRVRGVLLAPLGEVSERVTRLRRRGIPIVLVDRVVPGADACSVAVDDVEGGRLAVAHLLDMGHTRLAFLGGPSTLVQVRDRRQGAEEAVRLAGGDATLLTISTPGLGLTAGIRAAADLVVLPEAERPSAVFAANDLLAIGLLQGLVTAGLRVPEDVAIIGYDDIAFAAAAAVPLSSVRQPRTALGETAARLLLEEVEAADAGQPHEHRSERFVPELVVRRSTAHRV